jgi:hypothetical protein
MVLFRIADLCSMFSVEVYKYSSLQIPSPSLFFTEKIGYSDVVADRIQLSNNFKV